MTSQEEQKTTSQASKPEIKQRQANVDSFWANFYTKHPGTVYNVLPTNSLAKKDTAQAIKSKGNGKRAVATYEEATLACKKAVDKIVMDCRRVNQKYRDPDFDIEFDLKIGKGDCLHGLDTDSHYTPLSTKSVSDIFTKPQFYINSASPSDAVQGRCGDCWFIAAIACVSNKKGLIERVCVARDEVIGVYGFVFHRDGEWFYTLIDDRLYVVAPDYYEALTKQKGMIEAMYNPRDSERKFRDVLQKGSDALYFGKCREDNETWLPLLEKAYAKAHGDYSALSGGDADAGIADLTGGVGTELWIGDILDKEKFWRDDVCHVNEDVLLSCDAGPYDDWQESDKPTLSSDRSGILTTHSYSILVAVEKNGQKLVKIRNPWNQSQFDRPNFMGEWSDGSKQWTPEWMQDLQHRFSDDKGAFWMSYEDMLDKFACIQRTRLFDDSWTITQRWTSINVPFTEEINQTEFRVTIEKDSPVVIVLSGLDNRYFQSMKGEYTFAQMFFLHSEGQDDYIVRSLDGKSPDRSAIIDLPTLEAGKYSVRMKVTASRRYWEEPEDSGKAKAEGIPERVLRLHYKKRPEKVLQQARAYDYAHAKGRVTDTDDDAEEAECSQSGGDVNVDSTAKDAENSTAAEVTSDASKATPTLDPAPKTDKKDDKKKTPQGEIDRHNDELAQNPWNAVCVVGLRVFSKDENCSIKVIRPFRQENNVPKHVDDQKKQPKSESEKSKSESEKNKSENEKDKAESEEDKVKSEEVKSESEEDKTESEKDKASDES